jgi:hypothetical protein
MHLWGLKQISVPSPLISEFMSEKHLIHFGIDRTRFQLTKPEQVNSLDPTEHMMKFGYDRTSDAARLRPNYKLI